MNAGRRTSIKGSVPAPRFEPMQAGEVCQNSGVGGAKRWGTDRPDWQAQRGDPFGTNWG